jgi:hypothetical protein
MWNLLLSIMNGTRLISGSAEQSKQQSSTTRRRLNVSTVVLLPVFLYD